MAENYSKSKLKRKRSSVEDVQPEISSKGTRKRSHATLFSGDITAEPGRSVVPAAAWWNREQLPAVEGLWALSLKSALPYLENQHWDLVPDLPLPSTARPAALKSDDQRWCDLCVEVAAFPEHSPPSPRTSSPERAPDPPDRPLSPHSRQSPDESETTALQAFTKGPRPEAAASAGPSSAGGEEGRKGGEQEQETGPVNRRLLTNQVRVSDSRVSLQKEAEEEKEEVQRSVFGGGGLQSCPMCLLVFPVGFTQMDCDGHLAQCLSEVNVDVTW